MVSVRLTLLFGGGVSSTYVRAPLLRDIHLQRPEWRNFLWHKIPRVQLSLSGSLATVSGAMLGRA